MRDLNDCHAHCGDVDDGIKIGSYLFQVFIIGVFDVWRENEDARSATAEDEDLLNVLARMNFLCIVYWGNTFLYKSP